MLRALGLILVGFGLFVQTAAHASALPQEPRMVERNCNDMVMKTTDDEGSESPCADVRLDCLVALGCIPPLVMPQDLAAVQVRLVVLGQFNDLAFFELTGTGAGPEPPPPQA